MHAAPPQLLFSVAVGDAVQRAGHAGGAYAALPRPRPLRAEWLAVLLPPAAAGRALSLRPRGCCLNRRAVPAEGMRGEARRAGMPCACAVLAPKRARNSEPGCNHPCISV
jgi:hypothetical protein